MLKRSRRFFQSGKISGVLKIDAYMVRRSKIWSLHRLMHPFTSTLNRGEGLLKIVTFPSRKGVFRLLTETVEMSSEMRLYRNWRRLCRSSMDWCINLLRYEISQIFDFFLIFLDSFTWFLWLFSKKCRKFPKMSTFPSRNAYLRSDEPGVFLWASVFCWHAKRARRFWYALVALFEQQRWVSPIFQKFFFDFLRFIFEFFEFILFFEKRFLIFSDFSRKFADGEPKSKVTRDFWRFRAWLVPFFPRPWSAGARHG